MDLGLAEKMAIRAVAAATDVDQAEVAALVRETGDLGQTAEQLRAAASGSGPAERLTVVGVVNTLRQIANAEGTGSQGLSWSCWPCYWAGPPRWRPGTWSAR